MMQVQAALPADGEAFELVEWAMDCSTTHRILPSPMILLRPRCGMIGSIRLERSQLRKARES